MLAFLASQIKTLNILFVEQNDKMNPIKKWFYPIEIKKNIMALNTNLEKMSLRKKIKLSQKVKKTLDEKNCKTVVASTIIKKNKEFMNLLYSNNIEIIEGKWLFKMLIYDIVDYILNKRNKVKEKSEITITVNRCSNWIEEIIKNLAINSKAVKIVTSHIEEFQKLEESLYEEGIIITVSNNKRKSLANSNIILNIDFPKEIFNTYKICDEAIIINFEEEVIIRKKRFTGIIINSYTLEIKKDTDLFNVIKENNFEKYDLNDICEYYTILDEHNLESIKIKSLIKANCGIY